MISRDRPRTPAGQKIGSSNLSGCASKSNTLSTLRSISRRAVSHVPAGSPLGRRQWRITCSPGPQPQATGTPEGKARRESTSALGLGIHQPPDVPLIGQVVGWVHHQPRGSIASLVDRRAAASPPWRIPHLLAAVPTSHGPTSHPPTPPPPRAEGGLLDYQRGDRGLGARVPYFHWRRE